MMERARSERIIDSSAKVGHVPQPLLNSLEYKAQTDGLWRAFNILEHLVYFGLGSSIFSFDYGSINSVPSIGIPLSQIRLLTLVE